VKLQALGEPCGREGLLLRSPGLADGGGRGGAEGCRGEVAEAPVVELGSKAEALLWRAEAPAILDGSKPTALLAHGHMALVVARTEAGGLQGSREAEQGGSRGEQGRGTD